MASSRAVVATFLIAFLLQVGAHDDCDETGICEHVDDYPIELVRSLIQELKSKNTLFNYDEIDVNLQSRNNGYREELCEFTVQNMIPKKAKDVNGTMRIILNDDGDKAVQKYNVGTCKSREANCTNLLRFIIPKYQGICIQNFAQREMIYVDDKNKTALGYFNVPTCCSCKLLRLS